MAERSPATGTDPIAAALAFAIRRAVQREAAEREELRRTMAVVDGKEARAA